MQGRVSHRRRSRWRWTIGLVAALTVIAAALVAGDHTHASVSAHGRVPRAPAGTSRPTSPSASRPALGPHAPNRQASPPELPPSPTQPLSTAVDPVKRLPSATVLDAVPGTRARNIAITVGQLRRSYLVVTPTTVRPGLPLLMVLHGSGASPILEANRTQFMSLAASGTAIEVYPAGYSESWNAGGGCCGLAAAHNVDDPAFLSAVRADVQKRFGTDAARSYLVGYSNGGKLALRLACSSATTGFAAVAVYAAYPEISCHAATPIPVFLGFGAADTGVPYDAPPTSKVKHRGITDVADWTAVNGCAAAAITEHYGPATISLSDECSSGAALEYVVYRGMGHVWPGSGQVAAAADGASLIWAFLRSQHR